MINAWFACRHLYKSYLYETHKLIFLKITKILNVDRRITNLIKYATSDCTFNIQMIGSNPYLKTFQQLNRYARQSSMWLYKITDTVGYIFSFFYQISSALMSSQLTFCMVCFFFHSWASVITEDGWGPNIIRPLKNVSAVQDVATRGLLDQPVALCAVCCYATLHNTWSYNNALIL